MDYAQGLQAAATAALLTGKRQTASGGVQTRDNPLGATESSSNPVCPGTFKINRLQMKFK